MPLERSVPVTRRQLAALSGGVVVNYHHQQLKKGSRRRRHPNPLHLATPVSYTGGAAFATTARCKGGTVVAHITIKEESNRPLPDSDSDELVIYRFAGSGTTSLCPADVRAFREQLLRKNNSRQPAVPSPVPIFWEPVQQPPPTATTNGGGEDDCSGGGGGGKRVVYVGHWKCCGVEVKDFCYLDIPRCAVVRFRFDRFDRQFAQVIADAVACGRQKETTANNLADDVSGTAPAARAAAAAPAPAARGAVVARKKRKVTTPKKAAPTKQQSAPTTKKLSLSLRSTARGSRVGGRSCRAQRQCTTRSVWYTDEPEGETTDDDDDDDDFVTGAAAEDEPEQPPARKKRAANKKPQQQGNVVVVEERRRSSEPKRRTAGSWLCAEPPAPRAAPGPGPVPKDGILVPRVSRFSWNDIDNTSGSTTETPNLPVVFAGRTEKKKSTSSPGAAASAAKKKPPPPASPAAAFAAAPEVVDLTQSDDDDEDDTAATTSPKGGFGGRDYHWAWSPTSRRRPAAARKSIAAKRSPTTTNKRRQQQQYNHSAAAPSSPAGASLSPALRATTETESFTANNSGSAAATNDSKPPALTFFRIHVRGGVTDDDDSFGQSVGVPSRADNNMMTFRTVREAIEAQLVPHRIGRNVTWRFFVPSLGVICPPQEGWELIPLLEEAGTGRASDPYKTTIVIT